MIEAYDADLTTPSIELNYPIPNWLNLTILNSDEPGIAKAELRGKANVGDEGTYLIDLKGSDGVYSINQSFQLEIRIDDYPPQFLSTKNGLEITRTRVFIDEDSNISENWNLPTNYYAYDPDPEESSQLSLVFKREFS